MGRDFRAIVIGIEHYNNAPPWGRLKGVRSVASNFARAIRGELLNFPDGGLKREAEDRLSEYLRDIPDHATLFLLWIGHGHNTPKGHYLICRDSPDAKSLDSRKALPSTDLAEWIANSKAQRIIVVLDTCNSGAGATDVAFSFLKDLQAALPIEGREREIAIIASTHALDKTDAAAFSKGMARALEGNDRWAKGDQVIMLSQLRRATLDVLGSSFQATLAPPINIGEWVLDDKRAGQPFIPNPIYRPAAGDTDIETARRLEGVFGQGAHFDLSARGIETGEAGFFFSGRLLSQQEVIRWLNGGGSSLMVITGPPGSGKSALIGRLVTLSVPEVRDEIAKVGAWLPGDPVPPDNSIDVSVHAKGKSVFQVATAIGHALGISRDVVDEGGIDDILAALEARGKPLTVVIDALDEAGVEQSKRIANEVVRPLVAMPHVRVLVGTRRSLEGGLAPEGEERHGPLAKAFGTDTQILDLEDEAETGADIAAFVGKRLRSAQARGSDDWIEAAAARVSDAAGGSFLYARLVARSLESTPDAVLDAMPSDSSAAFIADITARFPEDQQTVIDMLRALAFAFGLGLSRAVWAPIATALADEGRVYTDNDVVEMLRNVGSYIVETTVETDGVGQAAYRLIHQALADHLQQSCQSIRPNALIVRALMHGIEGAAWLTVDAYIARHLAEHAAHAHLEPGQDVRFDRLFDHAGFLAAAAPSNFSYLLGRADDFQARALRDIYRLTLADLRQARAPERWALLHRTAMSQNSNLATWLVPPSSAPWKCVWSQTTPAAPHTILGRHEGPVSSVALGWVEGRTIIVSGSYDRTIRLWDAATGSALGAPITGHEDNVRSVALGVLEGRTVIVSGSDDRTIRLWDAATGAALGAPITGHEDNVRSVALGVLEGRTVIVSGSDDRTIRLWDAATGAALGAPITGHEDNVRSVALGVVEGRTVIVSGSDDRTIRLWDAATGAALGAPITGHEDNVRSVALGVVDGRTVIVSGSDDRTIRLWDAATGAALGAPITGHEAWVRTVVLGVADSHSVIVSGSHDRTVRLWDVATRTALTSPFIGHEARVSCVALGKVEGRSVIISGSHDRTIRLWETAMGAALVTPITCHERQVRSVAIGVVKGCAVVVSGSDDCTIRIWDAATGAALRTPLTGHEGWIRSVVLGTMEGREVIVSGSNDRTVRVWDAATGAALAAPLSGHEDRVNCTTIGTVEGRTVIVSGSDDRTIRLWDAATGAALGTPITGHEDNVRSVALGVLEGRTVIVSGSDDRTIRLWDAATGAALGAPITGHEDNVRSVALGVLEGRTVIVSGSDDRTIRLWDAATGATLGAPTTGHEAWVRTVAIGQIEGRMTIVSGSDDRTVRLWDPIKCQSICVIRIGHKVIDTKFSVDGSIFVATSRGVLCIKLIR